MKKFVIIDGNAIIHRAYHALPPMTTREGVMVNAVYGFTTMLFKVLHDVQPEYAAVTFDVSGGSAARKEMFDGYKATRVKADQELYDQIPLVHSIVEAFGIPIYEKQGYEADDVIGTIVRNSGVKKMKDLETYIVTGDMDTLQLIDDDTVFVYTLRKGMADVVIYNEASVRERYGFGPELMVDYKALRGDPSDNIPGVPGIGEKGATELIQKVGGIDEIYKKIDTLKNLKIRDSVIKKLQAGEDKARMSRKLATIDCNVPGLDFSLEKTKVKPISKEKITPLFQKFEFVSLLKRVGGASEQPAETTTEKRKKRAEAEMKFFEVATTKELNEMLKKISDNGTFACEFLTTSTDVFAGTITGAVVVVGNEAFHVRAADAEAVAKLFLDERLTVIGHDVKKQLKILMAQKSFVPASKLFDTMIASYLLAPGSRAHDVGAVVLKVLGKTLPAATGQESLFGVDPKMIAYTLHLVVQLKEELERDLRAVNNLGLFQTIEMPLVPVLAEMENNGVAVDTAKLSELSARVNGLLAKTTEKIYEYAGHEFNIASPIQLREVLFDELDIPVDGIKKGKTGLSTSAEQLEKMRGLHPIIEEIENFRELSKLQNTYIDVLPTLINKKTGRIHTSFNQAVAATGRLSSTDPNLQNIPIRTELGREIREAFVGKPGNVLVNADYSQIELRIVASLAQDKKMLEIFENGEDIHTATAAAIHGVPLSKVTKDMRRSAKEINFGVLYGMGVYGLAWRAEIPHFQAKAFIEKYFSEFSGVKKYIDQTLEFTKKEGYAETLFGRRRYIPELRATNFQLRSAGERMAINHPIQGTAADLMKLAMIKVQAEIRKLQNSEIRLVLQVHDELVLDVPKSDVDAVKKLLKTTMESVAKLRVPIEVHVASGRDWGHME